MAQTKNGADALVALREVPTLRARVERLETEVQALRARVERLERARAPKRSREEEPAPPPRVLSLSDPEPDKDAEFIHPLVRKLQQP